MVLKLCMRVVALSADHVVPDVKPRDVSSTPAAAAAAGGGGKMTSQGEDLLDVIDQLSQTTSGGRPQSDANDDIFPL